MATTKTIATTLSSHFRRTLFSSHNTTNKLPSSFFGVGNKCFYSTGPEYTSDFEPAEEAPESGFTPDSLPDGDAAPGALARDNNANASTQNALEGGLDLGIYKAIIVGQVGQAPVQKKLKNGRTMTLTTVGTGGIRNERIPFPTEEPREYADRCSVQWHRVCVYPDRLGELFMKHAQPGSLLYLEGNLETKIFTDPITGLVRRIREIAVRRNGRIVFLGNGGDFSQPTPNELKGAGYF